MYPIDDVSLANNYEKESFNRTKIYLLKACSNQCIKEFNAYNLLKNESECMDSCFKDYLKLFYEES